MRRETVRFPETRGSPGLLREGPQRPESGPQQQEPELPQPVPFHQLGQPGDSRLESLPPELESPPPELWVLSHPVPEFLEPQLGFLAQPLGPQRGAHPSQVQLGPRVPQRPHRLGLLRTPLREEWPYPPLQLLTRLSLREAGDTW